MVAASLGRSISTRPSDLPSRPRTIDSTTLKAIKPITSGSTTTGRSNRVSSNLRPSSLETALWPSRLHPPSVLANRTVLQVNNPSGDSKAGERTPPHQCRLTPIPTNQKRSLSSMSLMRKRTWRKTTNARRDCCSRRWSTLRTISLCQTQLKTSTSVSSVTSTYSNGWWSSSRERNRTWNRSPQSPFSYQLTSCRWRISSISAHRSSLRIWMRWRLYHSTWVTLVPSPSKASQVRFHSCSWTSSKTLMIGCNRKSISISYTSLWKNLVINCNCVVSVANYTLRSKLVYDDAPYPSQDLSSSTIKDELFHCTNLIATSYSKISFHI